MSHSIVRDSAVGSAPDRDAVRAVLNEIVDPCSTASVMPVGMVDMGLVSEIEISTAGAVVVHMRKSTPSCLMVSYFAKEVDRMLLDLPGVTSVELIPDDGLEWDSSFMSADALATRRSRLALLVAAPRGDASAAAS